MKQVIYQGNISASRSPRKSINRRISINKIQIFKISFHVQSNNSRWIHREIVPTAKDENKSNIIVIAKHEEKERKMLQFLLEAETTQNLIPKPSSNSSKIEIMFLFPKNYEYITNRVQQYIQKYIIVKRHLFQEYLMA